MILARNSKPSKIRNRGKSHRKRTVSGVFWLPILKVISLSKELFEYSSFFSQHFEESQTLDIHQCAKSIAFPDTVHHSSDHGHNVGGIGCGIGGGLVVKLEEDWW